MTKMEMMNEMMKKVGLENEWTIKFCQFAENEEMTEETVKVAFDYALAKAFEEEEDF